MFNTISFMVGNKTIEINEKVFSLGELTIELLNLTEQDYRFLNTSITNADTKLKRYINTKDMRYWYEANEEYIKFEEVLCKYSIFREIRNSEIKVLEETKKLTSSNDISESEDFGFTEFENKFKSHIDNFCDYLETPGFHSTYNDFILDKQKEEPKTYEELNKTNTVSNMPKDERAFLVFPGDIKKKFAYYLRYIDKYKQILHDIEAFNSTIRNFINLYLSKLKKLNSSNYAEALYNFYGNPFADKLIANSIRGNSEFFEYDNVVVRHIPRETEKGSGIFKIYEYYETKDLQALLKIDFFKALEAGFIIRKCEYCGRYFLLKKAYHTKYCDRPAPDDPNHTCAQLGYHFKGIKEEVATNPKAQSLSRCYKRIEKDYSRKIITAEEKDILYSKAKDLYHEAMTNPNISNDDFEKLLTSKLLYELCNIKRRTNPRGRPKKS